MSSAELTAELVAAVDAQHRVLLVLRPMQLDAGVGQHLPELGGRLDDPLLGLVDQIDAAAQLGYGALVKASQAGLR